MELANSHYCILNAIFHWSPFQEFKDLNDVTFQFAFVTIATKHRKQDLRFSFHMSADSGQRHTNPVLLVKRDEPPGATTHAALLQRTDSAITSLWLHLKCDLGCNRRSFGLFPTYNTLFPPGIR